MIAMMQFTWTCPHCGHKEQALGLWETKARGGEPQVVRVVIRGIYYAPSSRVPCPGCSLRSGPYNGASESTAVYGGVSTVN